MVNACSPACWIRLGLAGALAEAFRLAAEGAPAVVLPAQEALGRLNDDIVALQADRDSVVKDPRVWFAVGWLSATQTHDVRACQKSLRCLNAERLFW